MRFHEISDTSSIYRNWKKIWRESLWGRRSHRTCWTWTLCPSREVNRRVMLFCPSLPSPPELWQSRVNPGSHFMANSKCQLPTGSFRVQKKAWTRMKRGEFLGTFFLKVLRAWRVLECWNCWIKASKLCPGLRGSPRQALQASRSECWGFDSFVGCLETVTLWSYELPTLMPLDASFASLRSKLPTWCQEAFPGATKLNTVQSKAQQHFQNGQHSKLYKTNLRPDPLRCSRLPLRSTRRICWCVA